MTKRVTVAATQMSCSWEQEENIQRADEMVREAAGKGAQIILLQELFETPYFCIEIDQAHMKLATSVTDNPAIQHFSQLAQELDVVIPVSFFERAGQASFNSIAIIDASGEVLGVYRKTHIPDADAYQEKFYFSPGDTGFKVWQTKYAKIGVGICWDQWFPEAARDMVLQGAELLLYPTAIGSEPRQPELDSQPHWQRVMQGHSAANMVPVIASNRIGSEQAQLIESEMTFYGTSFITDHTGAKVAEMDRTTSGVIVYSFDLDSIDFERRGWGLFRDRVPKAYQRLATLDGSLSAQTL
ncbi:N-carbamoylputrescine amidase [Vibrio hippocampi]|uniref:N-carbamoyl-D-amino acid hydrolase n=1 Tax=Vibrio hippocampi TaxID=654686 RepID=A0ABN8DQ38_9VIBR|nr:N-carbamoylputrescine amidase [Vibrio hippocampi]CAH0530418.1 N-carbamoyl-D-amino acid hydrolase [Vibrio hippocampi]